MINTPDDLLRDALGVVSSQCRKMLESANTMNTEQLRDDYEGLQRTFGILGIIMKHTLKGEAMA